MAGKKGRTEIDSGIAAQVLFDSDRTCCVCRAPSKPIQIHHIDDNPSNGQADNLAVLCLDHHRDTQIRGGFDRKLDAAQVRIYKRDWCARVASKRDAEQGSLRLAPYRGGIALRYLQTKEENKEFGYSFSADFVQVETGDAESDAETNHTISTFITNHLQRFRADHTIPLEQMPDPLQSSGSQIFQQYISHKISLFRPELLSIEFSVYAYNAGAMHPYIQTKPLNLRLRRALHLELTDIFSSRSSFLDKLAELCRESLYMEYYRETKVSPTPEEWAMDAMKEWIDRGTTPEFPYYQAVSVIEVGFMAYFDPYMVGPFTTGRHEVFIHWRSVKNFLRDDFKSLMAWQDEPEA